MLSRRVEPCQTSYVHQLSKCTLRMGRHYLPRCSKIPIPTSQVPLAIEKNVQRIQLVTRKLIGILSFLVLSTVAIAEDGNSEFSQLEEVVLERDTLQRYSTIYRFISGLPDHELSNSLTEVWNTAQRRLSPQARYQIEIAILHRLSSVNPTKALKLAEDGKEDAWAPLLPAVLKFGQSKTKNQL